MLKAETKDIQYQLAKYCRNGELEPIEGASSSRLTHYRRLVFNVVYGALKQAYPIAYHLLGPDEFRPLVHDFFNLSNPSDPQVWRMPFELIEFVESHNYSEKLEKPYLLDLLNFEWVEIEVHSCPDEDIVAYDEFNGKLNQKVVLNPYLRVNHLQYPVHKLKPTDDAFAEGNFFVLTHRNIETGVVRFTEMSPFYLGVLEALDRDNLTPLEAVEESNKLFRLPEEDVKASIQPFFDMIYKEGILLGALR